MHEWDRPSLLFVGNFLDRTLGSRAVSEDLSLHLEDLGWPVHRASREQNKLLRLADMLYTAWSSRSAYDIGVVDVFSGPAFRFAEAVCWLLSTLGKPYVLTLHGGNLPAFSARNRRRVRALLSRAARVTTPSRYLQEKMRPYRQDLCLIPNAISLARACYRPRRHASPALIWLRAYHKTYNLPLALRAVHLLKDQFPDLTLTVIGPDKRDGTLRAAQAEVAQCGLGPHVRLLGAVPNSQVPEYLDQADVFLNTTDVDNTPVSVLEAMACGLCVVSTNVGGLPYLLTHEVNGLLVDPDDAQSFAGAVRRVLTSDTLAGTLSLNARRMVEPFDWSAVVPAWQDLLRDVHRLPSVRSPSAPSHSNRAVGNPIP